MTATDVIDARALTRRFGARVTVDAATFSVGRAGIFGSIGPNARA